MEDMHEKEGDNKMISYKCNWIGKTGRYDLGSLTYEDKVWIRGEEYEIEVRQVTYAIRENPQEW